MATACDPVEQGPVDFPIEGNFTISASYTAMVHGGGYGWRNGEQIGVFVTSEGVTQANLLYNPSDTSKVEIITGTDYWGDPYEMEDRSIIGDVELTPAAEAAGYKKGEHVIYAYTPYVEGTTDLTAVPVADNAAQVADENAWMTYSFGYAKTTEAIKEFSSANISLGDFKPLIYPLSVSSIELTEEQAETFKNKKVTSVKIISTELDIALAGAKVNLETGEITGTKTKEIVITFPNGGKDVEFEAGFPPYFPDAYFIPTVMPDRPYGVRWQWTMHRWYQPAAPKMRNAAACLPPPRPHGAFSRRHTRLPHRYRRGLAAQRTNHGQSPHPVVP